MAFGVLLPHFGPHASPARIVDYCARLEELGFDAVWVRDHLLWRPNVFEPADRTFVEPLITLAAVASATRRMALGTAVLIPIRWPLKVAQELASLSYLAGGRVIAGMGLGSNAEESAAAGMDAGAREQIFRETVEIARLVWSGDGVSYRGQIFSFQDVTLRPRPPRPIPIWGGGTTRASVRRAVELCDGWMTGRLPLATLGDRLRLLRRLEAESGRRLAVGYIPLLYLSRTREEAEAALNVCDLMVASRDGMAKYWIVPEHGFRTLDDLEGLLVYGTPHDCADQIARLADLGIDHFVVDLRLQFDRYEELTELVGREILPRFRRAATRTDP
ncbi:MAG: LLM class flavin-dependent oxidoreductase [Armatimonadetes bacterium]|nr:LLM class flavin-dependent oxidoreductase [Armatimonadota bacterium]